VFHAVVSSRVDTALVPDSVQEALEMSAIVRPGEATRSGGLLL